MLPLGFQAEMFGASEGWHEEGEAADFRISRQQSFRDCALGELWEEAGIWLGWRRIEDFQWMTHEGHALPLGPAEGQSAFVVTEFQDAEDYVADCNSRYWLTLEECEREGLRSDHLQLLQCLSCHEQQRDAVALAITDLRAEDKAGTSAGLVESQEPAARKPRGTKRKRSRSLESSSGEQDG